MRAALPELQSGRVRERLWIVAEHAPDLAQLGREHRGSQPYLLGTIHRHHQEGLGLVKQLYRVIAFSISERPTYLDLNDESRSVDRMKYFVAYLKHSLSPFQCVLVEFLQPPGSILRWDL